MNKFQSFQQFLATQTAQIEITGFVVNLVLSALLSYALGRLYVRHGTSLSNRLQFSRNFVMITMTTMLIITIVKSSLALSLGLVGALSIVRFRAAIKEPEELAYLFLAISLGLGLGADQRVTTLVAFIIIALVVMVRRWKHRSLEQPNLLLTVAAGGDKKASLESIVETISPHFARVTMRRYDEASDQLEASFLVEVDNFEKLTQAKAALMRLSPAMKISFLDNRGII